MSSLAGKRALITGSTQGLGLAAARRLAEAGCHVVLNGLGDGPSIAAIQRDIETRYGVRAMYSPADLRNPDDIERMVAQAMEDLSGIDIVVNNAVVRHV